MKKSILLSLALASSITNAHEAQEIETIESNSHCYDWLVQLLSGRLYAMVQGHVNNDEPINKKDLLEAQEEFNTNLQAVLNDSKCGDIFAEYTNADCTQTQDCSTCDEDEASSDVTLDFRIRDIIDPMNLIASKKKIKMIKEYKKQRTLELLKKQINN